MSLRRIVAITLLTGISTIASGQAPPPSSLRLVTGDAYPPLSGVDLPAGGLATEIVVATFHEIGVATEIEFLPWKRGLQATQQGQFFGTFPYVLTEQRQSDFLYSDSLFTLESRYFVRADADLQSTTEVAGRPDLTECLPLGFPQPTEAVARHEFVNPPTMQSCFQMILQGRADFFLVGDLLGWATARRMGIRRRQLRTLEGPAERVSQHLIVPRDQPGAREILARFDAALQRLREDGAVARLISEHSAPSPD